MVLARNGNGYAITSQNYFSELETHLDRELDSASRSSLCEARQKLSWRAFEYLLNKSVIRSHELADPYKWKGHVVNSIDGSKLTLPHSPAVLKEFPQRKAPNAGDQAYSHYPYALMVTACNVLTGQPRAARVLNMHGSEREATISMIQEELEPGEICLLDRGLDGFRVWNALEKRDQFYVSRLRVLEGGRAAAHFKYVMDFVNSGKSEQIIERKTRDPETKEWISFRVRLIRGRRLKDGSVLVLGTNLMNQEKYRASDILELYALRWRIETMYHRVKILLQLQKFHARTVNGIYQEIFANLLILSMTAAIAVRAAIHCGIDLDQMAPNFKNAQEVLRRHLFYCLGSLPLRGHQKKRIAQQIIHQVARILCKKQPGRSYARYSRQPVNPWPHAKRNKIKLFKEGRRANASSEMRNNWKSKQARARLA